jgi:hypothetical protein
MRAEGERWELKRIRSFNGSLEDHISGEGNLLDDRWGRANQPIYWFLVG